MERLGQTVKSYFEYFDHLHFLCFNGKLVVDSKQAINSQIFSPWTTFSTHSFHGAVRRRSLRSLFPEEDSF